MREGLCSPLASKKALFQLEVWKGDASLFLPGQHAGAVGTPLRGALFLPCLTASPHSRLHVAAHPAGLMPTDKFGDQFPLPKAFGQVSVYDSK